MWYDNPNLVYTIMKVAIRNPNIFSRLMSMSMFHYSMGISIMNNTKEDVKCKCDCTKNKEYKMKDEARKLHCNGCVDTIELNCWNKSDYNSNLSVKSNICKKCFKDHWYRVMRRKMSLCLLNNDSDED